MNLNINLITREAFACIADIGAGRHNNGDRGTTELSAKLLGPLAATMRDFDWSSGESFASTRQKLITFHEMYPDILESYPALRALILNEETPFQ